MASDSEAEEEEFMHYALRRPAQDIFNGHHISAYEEEMVVDMPVERGDKMRSTWREDLKLALPFSANPIAHTSPSTTRSASYRLSHLKSRTMTTREAKGPFQASHLAIEGRPTPRLREKSGSAKEFILTTQRSPVWQLEGEKKAKAKGSNNNNGGKSCGKDLSRRLLHSKMEHRKKNEQATATATGMFSGLELSTQGGSNSKGGQSESNASFLPAPMRANLLRNVRKNAMLNDKRGSAIGTQSYYAHLAPSYQSRQLAKGS